MNDGIIRTKEGIYVLRDDSHLSRWIEQHGRLDIAHNELASFTEFLPVGGTVIDAGASLGDHALTYAKCVGPNGTVFAFEPNPLSFAALSLNLGNWRNVKLFNSGLSDREEKHAMSFNQNVGASFVDRTTDGDVLCYPLDRHISEMDRCDFIHLDCEGFELPALIGAKQVIATFRPVILFEIVQKILQRTGIVENDIFALMDEYGYCCQGADPTVDDCSPQRDILAIPE